MTSAALALGRAADEVRGGRLARLLENLAANGAEAARSAQARELCIDWQPIDGAIEITVEDSGPGFEESAAMVAPNTGVGLLSARRIVGSSQGMLRVDRSERLGGARCVVRLSAPARNVD